MSAPRKQVLRVLVAHNAYQHRGGEDMVVDSEVALLRQSGHQVDLLLRHNDELSHIGAATAALDTLWSRRTVREVGDRIATFRPDIVHVHNTFPLISPSLYWACVRAGVPVVQTLHNFRLACPQAMFLRDGRVCEDCLGRAPLPAVLNNCYRGSKAQTAVLAGMLMLHRGIGTWQNKVARYIALNDFCRDKFIETGLPPERIAVKPNFVEAPAWRNNPSRSGFLFVGRLSPEKGVAVLADAWRSMPDDARLSVAGVGPESHLIGDLPGALTLGPLPLADIQERMSQASALILPSIWYENFPRTLVEAMAAGLPVIASRIGALACLVKEGETGLLFEPGNATDLASKMSWARANPSAMAEMGKQARRVYDEQFTPERNLAQLLEIYAQASATRT